MALTLVTATAAHVTLVRAGATAVRVLDENTGNQIGYAERIRGFIHYTGTRGSAHEGMSAVVRSTDSTYVALTRALTAGLRNGRDDRTPVSAACNQEISDGNRDDPGYAYCGHPAGHAGPHGNWKI
jgi:hypothetical protein